MRLLAEDRRLCQRLTGTFRTRHGRTRFTAHRLPTCGNETVEDGETCDDGNLDGGDCCSATCEIEPGCAGPCERSSDCNPAAVCARQPPSNAAACPGMAGSCEYLSPATRESICPSSPQTTSAVCGCDRRSYRTTCDAWAAGVAGVAAGRCPCQDSTGLACPVGYWCDLGYPWYTCDDTLARTRIGECVELGVDCDGVEQAPVCGCDGITYPNDCVREQARVRAATGGVCPAP
jgi:cysteine-rich repeat protein